MDDPKPRPGTEAARALGCLCSFYANAGRDFAFPPIIFDGCKMHGRGSSPPKPELARPVVQHPRFERSSPFMEGISFTAPHKRRRGRQTELFPEHEVQVPKTTEPNEEEKKVVPPREKWPRKPRRKGPALILLCKGCTEEIAIKKGRPSHWHDECRTEKDMQRVIYLRERARRLAALRKGAA